MTSSRGIRVRPETEALEVREAPDTVREVWEPAAEGGRYTRVVMVGDRLEAQQAKGPDGPWVRMGEPRCACGHGREVHRYSRVTNSLTCRASAGCGCDYYVPPPPEGVRLAPRGLEEDLRRARPSPSAGRRRCCVPGCRRMRAPSRSRCREHEKVAVEARRVREAERAAVAYTFAQSSRLCITAGCGHPREAGIYCLWHLTHSNREPRP